MKAVWYQTTIQGSQELGSITLQNQELKCEPEEMRDYLEIIQEKYPALTLEAQLRFAPKMYNGDYLRAEIVE